MVHKTVQMMELQKVAWMAVRMDRSRVDWRAELWG